MNVIKSHRKGGGLLNDDALDRPQSPTSYCAACVLTWAPQMDAGVRDEALDRSRATAVLTASWGPEREGESRLSDEVLDRPRETLIVCGTVSCALSLAPQDANDLQDDALDRPEGTVAFTGGLPFSFAPSSPEAMAGEALDRPTAGAAFCICGISEEALDRPTASPGFCRDLTRAAALEQKEGARLLDDAVDRASSTTAFCHPTQPTPDQGESLAEVQGGKVVRLSDYRKSRALERLAA